MNRLAKELGVRNPFSYGGIVSGDAFCNRAQEKKDLSRAIENRQKLFLYAERRMGKTSLIKVVLNPLSKKDYISIYIDLYPTTGELSFVEVTAAAIANAVSAKLSDYVRTLREFFGRLGASVSVDSQGNPTVVVGMRSNEDALLKLETVLSLPEAIAARRKKTVVVVFDEFQQIAAYSTDAVERTLRSVIQTHERTAYIFMGSREHLIQDMFLNKARPLYRSASHYPLAAIAEIHWKPFIKKWFEQAHKAITPQQIGAICGKTQGHPFYTQHLCHALWEICEGRQAVEDTMIEQAINLILDRENYAYAALWESLTASQASVLKALAADPSDIAPYAADFIARHHLKSASTVQRALEALITKDIIEKDNGAYLVSDRFFRLWIQRL